MKKLRPSNSVLITRAPSNVLRHESPLPPGERVRVRGGVPTNLKPTKNARVLRKTSTETEKILWRVLRNRRFSDFKFRRQHSIGSHILDFFCISAKLNIEIDGGGHGHPAQLKKDTERDEFLKAHGIRTLRFWNHQLRRNLDVVRQTIWLALHSAEAAPHLNPLPKGERKYAPVSSNTPASIERSLPPFEPHTLAAPLNKQRHKSPLPSGERVRVRGCVLTDLKLTNSKAISRI